MYGEKIQEKSMGNKKYGKKTTGKNSKAGQVLFRSHDFVTSGERGPTRADIVPFAHAQNILPNRASSGHVTSDQACTMVRSPSIPLKY